MTYAEARFLKTSHSRWATGDPVLGDITNPQRLNAYAYVSNDPANRVDRNGKEGEFLGCSSIELQREVSVRITDWEFSISTYYCGGYEGAGTPRREEEERAGGVAHQPISRLRVRGVPELDDPKLALSYCLFKKAGFGNLDDTERLAFTVEEPDGSWSLWTPPRKATPNAESYKGAVPDGTIGVVHTHPSGNPFRVDAEGPDAAAVGLRQSVSGVERINWNFILHRDGIGVTTGKGEKQILKERSTDGDWWDSVKDTNCEGKLHDFKP